VTALPHRLPQPAERDAAPGTRREAVPGRIVYKFGGSSVADAQRIQEVARLVAGAPTRPVVVVSAMGGVTDHLVVIAESIGQGNDVWRNVLPELETRHANAVIGLTAGDAAARADLERDVASAFARIPEAATRSWTGREAELWDLVTSLGEDLSARLNACALRAAGVPAEFVDARFVVRTDDHFGRARPASEEISRLARERLVSLLQRGTVPVLQGFVGATADGRTTTLGRGGSDYSAAILGAALGAEEVHIWTDVDGILSGDPRAVDQPRILREIGFEEAVELSYFGAKVIHPGAAKHAVALGVPLRIRNTFHPEDPGTLILSDRRGVAEIAAVACKRGTSLIKVRSLPSALPYGFLARVFDVLARHELAVDLVATSHSSTVFSLDRNEDLAAVTEELSEFAEVDVRHGLATVTVVGHGLMEEPGTDALVFWEVGRTPVHLISQASDVSLSFLVDEDQAPDLVRRLHTALIELRDEEGRARLR
jgi:aspartate kinase